MAKAIDIKTLKNKKLLVLVESPNKVKHISQYLKDAGYVHTIVMASVGHISALKDNKASYKNTGIYPEDGFRMNLAVTEDKAAVVKKLKEQVDIADYVFLMTDGDREGEAIAWSLIKFLKIKPSKCFRAITHEITKKAVVSAIENPIELNDNLVEAAHARQTIDKLVGYTLSPIAKAYIGAKSVGRCQSAGLKLVVDREKEIQNFVPEKFYDIYVNFEKNGTKFKAKYVGTDKNEVNHLTSIDDVNVVKYKCNDKYVVKSISTKERQESPKPPFCTATFQQEAASKLSLKVKDAMAIAQKLFENSYITYMRTDDTEFSPEFVDTLKVYTNKEYGVFVEPRKGKKQDGDQLGHECLRVTNLEITPEAYSKIDANIFNNKVYTLIWQRTVASVLPNAKYSETTYNIYNNDQKFVLISKELIDPGFKKVYNYSENESEAAVKETFKENEVLNIIEGV